MGQNPFIFFTFFISSEVVQILISLSQRHRGTRLAFAESPHCHATKDGYANSENGVEPKSGEIISVRHTREIYPRLDNGERTLLSVFSVF